ncbi:MAG: hypothetical protein ABSA07_05735 [Acidimicrobiales bacterium]
MSVEPSKNTSVLRLAAEKYADVDEDFVRFRDVPLDETVKSIVASVTAGDESILREFRSELDVDTIDTLRIYAKRRTIQARRRSSMYLADDAMDAFALIPTIGDVPWDSWLKAGLFVARSLGRDIYSIAERFGELSTREAARRFDVVFEAMSRVESITQCFLAEVSTNYGTGFIDILVHRDTQGKGAFYSAPRLPDDVVAFAPGTNLAQLAASLADAFDATQHVHTGAITQDQLAAMSFSQQVAGAFLETTGALSFYADGPDDTTSFKVFVAELPEGVDVESLAAGAEQDDQAVAYDDTRIILFVTPPNFDDDEDAAFDFSAYVDIARTTLRASLPVGWNNRLT